MYADLVIQTGINHGRLFQQTHRVSVKAPPRSVWAFLAPLVAIAMLLAPPGLRADVVWHAGWQRNRFHRSSSCRRDGGGHRRRDRHRKDSDN